MSPPPNPSQSSQLFSLINILDLDEDEFDPLFSQPSKGPSQPVEEDSPVEEVAPIKRKYVRRHQPTKKNDKDLCDPWTPKEECMTWSSTKELFTPFEKSEQEFRSSRKLFKTLSLDESSSPEFDLFSDLEEHSEEEVAGTMTETMEEYMCKTRGNYGSGVTRPKIDAKDHFELKGQFLKELRDNTFTGLDHEDANEHIEKFLEIVDLFHIPNITQDQIMLRVFPMSFNGATSRW
ncbi:hypothetical protein Tco_1554177, partial [Tanacetum coccineum]